MPGVFILIPAYNEEATIARVILESMKYGKVVVCDDGSTDYTGVIAERIGAEVVRHEWNRGYGAALRTLFKKVLEYDPEIVVTIDADMQHDPAYIPKIIKAMEDEDADIAIGARLEAGETPSYRRLGIKVISKMVSPELRDVQSGFRAYKGEIIRDIIPVEDDMSASIEIIEKAMESGFKIIEVPIEIRYRDLDTSTYNPLAHGYQLIARIIHSRVINRPISYLAIPGIITMIIGFLSGVWVVFRYIEVRELAIGTAIITAILLIVGLILVMVAIQLYAIKEYTRMNSYSHIKNNTFQR
jgi:glycosyltransferase involved in cell wall biosynthesis